MKKLIALISLSLLTQIGGVQAKEQYLCPSYYEDVKRKVGNLEKKDLSRLAKEALFDTVKLDLKQCLKMCEGYKFDYCNKIAKELEGS